MQLHYKLAPHLRPPIYENQLRNWLIRKLLIGGTAGLILAEGYRRFYTIPHIQRRTEYYEKLGVRWKSIV
jgi:hypothetical protein